MNIELRDQPAERGNTIALSDTQYADIKAVCPGLQGGVGIGDGTSCVIVAMKLDTHLWIAFGAETHQLFNLPGCSDTNGIRQANALDTCIDDSVEDGQQIHEVTAECILRGETHIAPGSPDAPDQWGSFCEYLVDAPAVTEGT